MGRCSDIKFHGHLIGTLQALNCLVTLLVSLYYSFSGAVVPEEMKAMGIASFPGYAKIIYDSIAVSLLFYGIYKENRRFLISFIIGSCKDLIYILFIFDRSHITNSLFAAGITVALNAYFLFVTIRLFLLFGRSAQSNQTSNKV